jgi:hypothetical protein
MIHIIEIITKKTKVKISDYILKLEIKYKLDIAFRKHQIVALFKMNVSNQPL